MAILHSEGLTVHHKTGFPFLQPIRRDRKMEKSPNRQRKKWGLGDEAHRIMGWETHLHLPPVKEGFKAL
jgi:hypothetical protein